MPTEAAVESHEGGMVVENCAGEECDSVVDDGEGKETAG